MADNANKRFQWAEAEAGWKGKGGKITPFSEMTDAKLRKLYKLAEFKQLQYTNRAFVFGQKLDEIEEEAAKRGLDLESLNKPFHQNRQVLKSAKED